MRQTKATVKAEGRKAFASGVHKHKNPYTPDSWQFKRWAEGWTYEHDTGGNDAAE